MDQSTNNINNEFITSNEELDLRTVFNFFYRNKIFLSKISLIFFILGIFYSFFPKKTWEGQFQIVVEMDKEMNPLGFSSNPLLSSIGGSFSQGNLKTQVGILESPSVLMPVYEFRKSKKNNESDKNESFTDWKKNNVSVILEKNTQILNISYKDKDKEIILPTLNKMSETYQKYSGMSKKRSLDNSRNYLEKQIEIYKVKGALSLKKVQEFAIDQDLMYFDLSSNLNSRENTFNQNSLDNNNLVNILNSNSLLNSNNPITPNTRSFAKPNSPLSIENINIENVRVQAANDLKKINLQLKKISELDDFKDLQYIGSTIPALVEAGLPQALQTIETQLVELRSKYTDQDISIKRLKEKRKLTIDLLRDRSINYLKAKKLELEATMEAAMRPKGVLLKYKELVRDADRDEKTLINLENQLRLNDLEASKQKVPWQLITKPTLLKYPVSPRKSYIALISLLIGLLSGIIYKIFKEKRSGMIYQLKELINIKSFKFIEKISLKDKRLNQDKISFLKEFINSQSTEKINLILLGEIQEEEIKTFKDNLSNQINKEFIIISNLEDIKENAKGSTNFILSCLGYVSSSQINIIKNYEKLMDINFQNLILVEK